MTIRPEPPVVPCMSIRARFALTPGLSDEYQERISRTRGVSRMGNVPSWLEVERELPNRGLRIGPEAACGKGAGVVPRDQSRAREACRAAPQRAVRSSR